MQVSTRLELAVYRLGKLLLAGELLGPLNPHGYGGRVWSASTVEKLYAAVNFETRPRGDMQ